MSATPYAGLLERLVGGRDRLRYLLNWSESNTRVSTVMKTFTMPDRQTAKDALEQLYKDIPEAAEAISSLLNALEYLLSAAKAVNDDNHCVVDPDAIRTAEAALNSDASQGGKE
jgi:hypothetical protein